MQHSEATSCLAINTEKGMFAEKIDPSCPTRHPKSSERIHISISSITEFEALLAVDVRDEFEGRKWMQITPS